MAGGMARQGAEARMRYAASIAAVLAAVDRRVGLPGAWAGRPGAGPGAQGLRGPRGIRDRRLAAAQHRHRAQGAQEDQYPGDRLHVGVAARARVGRILRRRREVPGGRPSRGSTWKSCIAASRASSPRMRPSASRPRLRSPAPISCCGSSGPRTRWRRCRWRISMSRSRRPPSGSRSTRSIVILVGLRYTRSMTRDLHYQAIRTAIQEIAKKENVLRISRYEAEEILERIRREQRRADQRGRGDRVELRVHGRISGAGDCGRPVRQRAARSQAARHQGALSAAVFRGREQPATSAHQNPRRTAAGRRPW